jgi:integrase
MRPRKDGTAAHAPRHRKLTELFVKRVAAEALPFNVWDTHTRGLVLRVQAKPSRVRAFKAVYRFHGRPRWYHIGDARSVGLADARKLTQRVMLAAAEGKDPVAERQAERGAGTFAELADRYLNEHAKKKNKSWKQARTLVERYLLPRWTKLDAKSIARADVKALIGGIAAPILANQVLAAASAIFSWGVKEEVVALNPCRGVDRNETKDRERVLADSEVPLFWKAFDDAGLAASSALKTILLTGQRPGEVARMRREHIVDGWWTLPGEPVTKLGWPGTKNGDTHRVWLSAPVQRLIAELGDGATTGFVFANERGRSIGSLDEAMRAICAKLGIEDKVTPHDLRRTHGTTTTKLGFGRDAMNRLQNHREGGISDVYDVHEYSDENKLIMEAVARHLARRLLDLAGEKPAGNVVPLAPVAKGA